jgi:Zn-dependent M28 family amino/carboxypeptidase
MESDAGAGHPLGFELKMPPAAVTMLQPLADILRPIGATLLHSSPYSPGSDIEPLVEAGVPGIGLDQDGRKYFDYHHTAADTLDKVDPQDLRENAAAMAVMGYALANMPEPLPR